MKVSDLGGVFKFFDEPSELPEDLKLIYESFIADPDAELKLDRDPEYYGPIIADYYRKNNASNHNKRIYNDYTKISINVTMFDHFESVKFAHKRHPNKMLHTSIDYININLDIEDYNVNDIDINISKINAMLKCNVFEYELLRLALFRCRFKDVEHIICLYPNCLEEYKSKINEQLYWNFQVLDLNYNCSIKNYIDILQFLVDHKYDISKEIDYRIHYAICNSVELTRFFFQNMSNEFRIEFLYFAIMQSSDSVFELIKNENYYKDVEPHTMQMLYDARSCCGSLRH